LSTQSAEFIQREAESLALLDTHPSEGYRRGRIVLCEHGWVVEETEGSACFHEGAEKVVYRRREADPEIEIKGTFLLGYEEGEYEL
jgi:hypothetical protein